MKKNTAGWMVMTLALVVGMLAGVADAQTTYTWTKITGGALDWSTGANWSGGVAPDPISGDTVDFSTVNIAANTTLTLGADRTATIWKFGDVTTINEDWIVAAGNKIILAGSTPTINVVNRTATLNNVLDGTAGLTKTGAGTLTLSGANTYSGTTTINASGGSIILNNLNAITNSTSVSVASGTSLRFAVGGTYTTAGTISIAGTGLSSLPANSAGALWFSADFTHSVLNAPINLTAAATISSYGASMTQTLGGAITGAGPLTINSTGGAATHTGVWTLGSAGNTSSYTGNTIIRNGSGLKDITVKLGVINALPVTTSLNLEGAANTAGSFATFDLNGFDQTLAGLTDSGSTASVANFGKRVINSSGTLSTLTLNIASGTNTYGTTGTRITAGTIGGLTAAGVAANNLALTKTGAGTLTLTSTASSFTGNILISNGTLSATGGSLGLNPTASALGNPQTVGRLITIGSAGTLNFGFTDVMGNSGSTVVATLVANGGLIKNTGASFNVLGPVQLNGGTLSSFGGYDGNYPSFFLNGTVTVGGSAVSTISSTGTNSQMGLRTAGTTFDVADAVSGTGSDLNVTGVLANWAGAANGAVIKTGVGTLTLSGNNTYNGPTTVRDGTLWGRTGGSCSNSTVTVTNAPGTAALGVVVNNTAQPWVCSDLTFRAGTQLKFSFAVEPSTVTAPLRIRNNLTGLTDAVVVVDPANIPKANPYPLLVAAGTVDTNAVPTLSGVYGRLAWGNDKTLYLTVCSTGTLFIFQ